LTPRRARKKLRDGGFWFARGASEAATNGLGTALQALTWG